MTSVKRNFKNQKKIILVCIVVVVVCIKSKKQSFYKNVFPFETKNIVLFPTQFYLKEKN